MPTILRVGPYRFFFYSGDGREPPHIHVERDSGVAKFWLDPVRLAPAAVDLAEPKYATLVGLSTNVHWSCWRPGMTTSAAETTTPLAVGVAVTDDTLIIDLSDGRTVSVPLARYPRLLNATTKERGHWRLVALGEGMHWPDVDEDISVASIIAGRPSTESAASLQRWLTAREA